MLAEAASAAGPGVGVGQSLGWQVGWWLPERHRPAWSSFVGCGMVGWSVAGP
jgi:hypothetical protein